MWRPSLTVRLNEAQVDTQADTVKLLYYAYMSAICLAVVWNHKDLKQKGINSYVPCLHKKFQTPKALMCRTSALLVDMAIFLDKGGYVVKNFEV